MSQVRNNEANQAQSGDTVKVHYTGQLEDGHVFDSSSEKDPIEFRIGEGRIIPGFEEAVVGMAPGESKEHTIPSEKAYGSRRDEMVVEVSRGNIPEGMDPQVGQWLEIATPDGGRAPVMVTSVSDDSVTIDANHPLAGKDLVFQITLVEII